MSLSSPRVLMLAVFASALAAPLFAQQNTPAPNPAQTASPQSQPASSQPASSQTATSKPEPGNEDIDRFFSIEATYSQVQGQPVLAGGAAFSAASGSVLDYTGQNKSALSGTIIVPLPSRSDIRFSYFRFLGSGDQTLNLVGATYFSVPYVQGNYLASSYTFQQGELSYEYLTLPWPAEERKFRLYLLFNMDYFNIGTVINAPYVSTVSSTGTSVTTIAYGSRDIIFPSFGLKIEYPFAKIVRLEASVSAFGFPGHAAFWEADGNASVHVTRKLELVLGIRSLFYKTSPQSDEYFSQTVYAPYGGLRYYLPNLR